MATTAVWSIVFAATVGAASCGGGILNNGGGLSETGTHGFEQSIPYYNIGDLAPGNAGFGANFDTYWKQRTASSLRTPARPLPSDASRRATAELSAPAPLERLRLVEAHGGILNTPLPPRTTTSSIMATPPHDPPIPPIPILSITNAPHAAAVSEMTAHAPLDELAAEGGILNNEGNDTPESGQHGHDPLQPYYADEGGFGPEYDEYWIQKAASSLITPSHPLPPADVTFSKNKRRRRRRSKKVVGAAGAMLAQAEAARLAVTSKALTAKLLPADADQRMRAALMGSSSSATASSSSSSSSSAAASETDAPVWNLCAFPGSRAECISSPGCVWDNLRHCYPSGGYPPDGVLPSGGVGKGKGSKGKGKWTKTTGKWCPGNTVKVANNTANDPKSTFVKSCKSTCEANAGCVGFVLFYDKNDKANQPKQCRLKSSCKQEDFTKGDRDYYSYTKGAAFVMPPCDPNVPPGCTPTSRRAAGLPPAPGKSNF